MDGMGERVRAGRTGGVTRMPNVSRNLGETVVPMHVSVIVSSTQRRGAEVFAESVGEGLSTAGWKVDLFSLSDRPADTDGVAAVPLSRVRPDELGRLDRGIVAALRTALRASAPDVVLANGSSTLQYSVAAVRTMRSRPKLAYASIGEPLYWAADWRRQLTYRFMLGMVDRVFSVSSRTAEQLTTTLGVRPERLRVLPTGVSDRFLTLEHRPSDGPLRVLWIGSLSGEKDPLAALDVIGKTAASVPVELTMAGDGPLRDQVMRRSDELALKVNLVGVVSDVTPLYTNADVLLLTSKTEGLPGVVLEAAAASLPVVGFDVGGVSEAVVDGATGFLIADRRIDDAAGALIALAGDDESRRAMGMAGRGLVAEHFTLDSAVARYDWALRELLEESTS